MASISGESLELEAKRKEDCSWHPCRVSLSSDNGKFGIIINFESCTEEDIIFNREDALTRLRFRSTPLQDGECFHIKEGECVLAMYKDQSKSIFLDAVIEKLNRVKHSNRVYCRCTFEIKWLNLELNRETTTVPSKSIMRLSSKGIDSHPVFAAFLNALSPTDGLEVPSFLSHFEETNCEADLHGMLEKQIEEISRLADGSMECSADLLLEVEKANLGGRKQSKAVVTSHISSNNSQNNFRRSTRSQNKQQVEEELKKELEEDKPFLSPLAARAALASLVHELPLKPEFSVCHIEKDGHENLVEKDSKKYFKAHSLDVTFKYMKPDASFQDNIPFLLNPIQNTDSGTPVESRGVSRPSLSDRRGATKKSKAKESPDQEKPLRASERSEGRKVSSPAIVNNSTDSTTGGKVNGQAITTRLTRSSAQKEILVSSNEVKKGSSNEKLTSPMHTTRLTRSGKQKEKSSLGSKQELEKSDLTRGKDDSSEDLVTYDKNESKKKRSVSLPIDPDTESTPERKKRTRASSAVTVTEEDSGAILRDGESSHGEKKKTISSKKPELRFSPRLRFLPKTRSQTKASPAC